MEGTLITGYHRVPLLPGAKPVNLRPYRYTYFQKVELEKIIEELLKNSIIQPPTSPYASPALLYWFKRKMGLGGSVWIIDSLIV